MHEFMTGGGSMDFMMSTMTRMRHRFGKHL